MVKQILCVGQSDSSGVAGIQADLKTIHSFGGYALSVVTAVAAKNTQGYIELRMMDEDLVRKQFDCLLEDFTPDVLKTGLLGNTVLVNLVSEYAEKLAQKGVKIIVDPVMGSTLGKEFLNKEARDALKRSLILHTDVLMPNVREAEDLTGMEILDVDDMRHAAEMLVTLGPKAVVLRGGDLGAIEQTVVDIIASDDGIEICQSDRQSKFELDGVGSTMSCAMAMCLAEDMSLMQAYERSRMYVNRAITEAQGLGHGRGPLNHCVSSRF